MVSTVRNQTNHEVLMKRFFEKYVSKRMMNYYCRKSGLVRNTVWCWKTGRNKPSTFEIICWCEAIAKHQKLNHEDLILEALDEIVNG